MNELTLYELHRLKTPCPLAFTDKHDSDAADRALQDTMALLVAIEDVKAVALDLTRIGHKQKDHAVSNLAGGLFIVHGRLKHRFSGLLSALQDI
ncbi:MAG: hypothetical protein R3268_10535 [Acidiferrobacterales bacterium]|nr:hypothetical protein [Acidiferrobacterales bacterium]